MDESSPLTPLLLSCWCLWDIIHQSIIFNCLSVVRSWGWGIMMRKMVSLLKMCWIVVDKVLVTKCAISFKERNWIKQAQINKSVLPQHKPLICCESLEGNICWSETFYFLILHHSIGCLEGDLICISLVWLLNRNRALLSGAWPVLCAWDRTLVLFKKYLWTFIISIWGPRNKRL